MGSDTIRLLVLVRRRKQSFHSLQLGVRQHNFTVTPWNAPHIADNSSRDPVDWLAFTGHWGDKQYPDNDPNQSCFLGIDALCKYTNGPTGPAFKQLQRKNVCPDGQDPCIVWDVLVQRDLDGVEV